MTMVRTSHASHHETCKCSPKTHTSALIRAQCEMYMYHRTTCQRRMRVMHHAAASSVCPATGGRILTYVNLLLNLLEVMQEWASYAKEKRVRGTAAVLHWRGSMGSRAFNAWLVVAEERQIRRLQLATALSVWRNRTLSGSFSSWRSFASDRADKKQLLARAMGRPEAT